MNWRDRARKLQEAPVCELTKPTREASVSFVSTQASRCASFHDSSGGFATSTRARETGDEVVPPLSPAQQADRREVLARLDGDPTIRRAFVNRFEGDVMIVTLAVRGVGTCDLSIPAETFDRNSLADYQALAACVVGPDGGE